MTEIIHSIENNSFVSNENSDIGQFSSTITFTNRLAVSFTENHSSSSSSSSSSGSMLPFKSSVPFPQVHRLRLEQAKTMDISHLTPTQLGIVEVDKCHHISTTITSKDSPPSYRVRVCKTCCKQDNHIELGTYVDQESAVLINDVHEILQERYDKLVVLTKEDKTYLHLLQAKKYDRQRGRDHTSIFKILAERSRPRDEKRKRKRILDGSTIMDDTGSNSNNSKSSSIYSSDGRSATISALEDESSSASGKLSSYDGYDSSNDEVNGHVNIGTIVGRNHPNSVVDAVTDSILDSPMHLHIHSSHDPITLLNETSYLSDPSSSSSSSLDAVVAAAAIESAANALTNVSKESDSESIRFPLTPKRPRAATFSVNSNAFLSLSETSNLSPMTTLTWLANMKDEELNAAKLLSELGCGSDDLSADIGIRSGKSYSLAISKNRLNTPSHENLHNSVEVVVNNEDNEDNQEYNQEYNQQYNQEDNEDDNDHIKCMDTLKTNKRTASVAKLHESDLRLGNGLRMNIEGRRVRSNSLPFLKSSDSYGPQSQPMFLSSGRSRSNSFSSDVAAITNEIGFIGIYSPEERRQRILRFLEKRKRRIWTKKVKYDVRKNFADSRIRVKGRFVRKEDEEQLKVGEVGGVDIYRPKKKSQGRSSSAAAAAALSSSSATANRRKSSPHHTIIMNSHSNQHLLATQYFVQQMSNYRGMYRNQSRDYDEEEEGEEEDDYDDEHDDT